MAAKAKLAPASTASSLVHSSMLPADAREILRRASLTQVTKGAPLARTKAIEQATCRVRAMYPNFFNDKE